MSVYKEDIEDAKERLNAWRDHEIIITYQILWEDMEQWEIINLLKKNVEEI
jgi:hypothetical protein